MDMHLGIWLCAEAGMKFKAVGDGKDFLEQDPSQPVDYMLGSKAAYENGTQAPDIVAEQEKMRWCDVMIFMFPLWCVPHSPLHCNNNS